MHDVIKMESEFAKQLLKAGDAERQPMYADFYDQKWRINLKMAGPTPLAQTRGASPVLLPTLKRLVRSADSVLEIGCGTGYLAFAVARMGPRLVVATDVSTVAVEAGRAHARATQGSVPEFRVASAASLPFEDGHFAFVYSVEVLEHLHERDVPNHLAEVLRVLRPGGSFWVLTPSRNSETSVHERWQLSDSDAQDEEIQDIHLKEWTYGELIPLLKASGFENLRSPWQHKFAHSAPFLPARAKAALETLLPMVPKRARRMFARASGVSNCSLIATKPSSITLHRQKLAA